MAPKKTAPGLPGWLPNPDLAEHNIQVPMVVQQIDEELKKHLGDDFGTRQPLEIGKQGWSAPFDKAAGKTALQQTNNYQTSINLLWVKAISDTMSATLNWRSIVTLADFYWNATKAVTHKEQIRQCHVPHAIHARVTSVDAIDTPLGWNVFDCIAGMEIMIALKYTVVCAILAKEELRELTNTLLTTQCKFHLVTDKVTLVVARMQFTENISCDNKALGFSALQES